MTSMHLRPDLPLCLHPAGNDAVNVLPPVGEIALVLSQDGNLGFRDSQFIAKVSRRSARMPSAFLHRSTRVQQSLDQVFVGHGGTVARAGKGGDR